MDHHSKSNRRFHPNCRFKQLCVTDREQYRTKNPVGHEMSVHMCWNIFIVHIIQVMDPVHWNNATNIPTKPTITQITSENIIYISLHLFSFYCEFAWIWFFKGEKWAKIPLNFLCPSNARRTHIIFHHLVRCFASIKIQNNMNGAAKQFQILYVPHYYALSFRRL